MINYLIRKTGTLIVIIFLSILLASIYGALHNQITYSISSEYFTIFKFEQFGFQEWGNNTPRITTAIVGVMATWWVGLYIGIMFSIMSLFYKDNKEMITRALNAICITLTFAVLFGIVGFLVAQFDSQEYISCCYPYVIQDGKAFMTVGTIHNFSYMGGATGAISGTIYQFIKRRPHKFSISRQNQNP